MKPRTELANIIKDNKSYLCDWKTMNVSVPRKQIPIHVARNEKVELTDHIFMATKKSLLFNPQITEEKAGKAG